MSVVKGMIREDVEYFGRSYSISWDCTGSLREYMRLTRGIAAEYPWNICRTPAGHPENIYRTPTEHLQDVRGTHEGHRTRIRLNQS